MQLARYPRTFGLACNNPKTGYILSRIDLSIMLKPTMPTFKLFPVSVRLFLISFRMDVVTSGAGFRVYAGGTKTTGTPAREDL
jgi:hypothetical protein